MTAHVFDSKIDSWLAVVLYGSALVSIVVGIGLFWRFQPGPMLAAVALIALGAGLPLWVLTTTRYTFESEELLVASGPFKWRIPLRQIRAVTPTRNPLSSPALSLDRLRIEYGDGRAMMVSPRDREGFLRALEKRRVSDAGAETAGRFAI